MKHYTGFIKRTVFFIVSTCMVFILFQTGCQLLNSEGTFMTEEPDDIVIEDAEEDVTVDYDKTDEIVIEDAEEEKTEDSEDEE